MAEITKLLRLGAGEPAGLGTGAVPWVEANGGRTVKESPRMATPLGNKVELDIGKDTAVGVGWVKATGGRAVDESPRVATPLGNKVGPAVGERTGVDAGGGMVGRVTGIGPSQARTSANEIRASPQADQVPIRLPTNSLLFIDSGAPFLSNLLGSHR